MSRRCPGLHCPGCGDGGGGIIALVVALVVIGAAIHAIWHAVVEAAAIAAVTVLSAAALAAVGGVAYFAYRARQNRGLSDPPRATIAARPVYRIPSDSRPGLSEPNKPPIEPTRVLTAEEGAAVVTQHGAHPEENR